MGATFHEEKLNHPATSLVPRYDVAMGRVLTTATDVHLVDGLTDGSGTQNATFVERAIALARQKRPIGYPYIGQPGKEGCIVVGYDFEGIPQSDDACYVLIRYDTPLPQGPLQRVNVVNIERNTFTRQSPMVLHPKNLRQIIIKAAKGAPRGTPDTPAYVPWEQPITRMCITASVPVAGKNLDVVESLVGSVNNRTWFGLPYGYWKFAEFREAQTNATTTSANYVTVECEFLTQRIFNWMWWEVVRSDYLGKPQPVDDATVNKAFNIATRGYVYDQVNLPGLTMVGNFPLGNFGAALGIGSYSQWLGNNQHDSTL